jgi:hypothetical protein
VAFNGGVRSLFEGEIVSVYDDELAQKRYEEVNARYRREIEAPARPKSALLRVADTGAGSNADRAYDEVVAARKALQEAQMAQDQGIEPREGERLGTGRRGRSRLTDEYWQRQERLAQDVEAARKQLDEALARWRDVR